MGQNLPESKYSDYQIWIDWKREIVSFHEADGFDPLQFASSESRQANIHILLILGFRFQ